MGTGSLSHFVREISAKLFGSARAERKRLAKGAAPGASDSSPSSLTASSMPRSAGRTPNKRSRSQHSATKNPPPWVPLAAGSAGFRPASSFLCWERRLAAGLGKGSAGWKPALPALVGSIPCPLMSPALAGPIPCPLRSSAILSPVADQVPPPACPNVQPTALSCTGDWRNTMVRQGIARANSATPPSCPARNPGPRPTDCGGPDSAPRA